MRFLTALIAGCALASSSVNAQSNDDPLAESAKARSQAGVKVHSDIAYDKIDGIDPARLSLDLYSSADLDSAPVVLFIHGGGWTGGDKEQIYFKDSWLLEEGFLVASANYRFIPDVPVATIARDIASATRWLKENAKTYGGDPSRIFLMGWSSGAHLVSVVGANPAFLEEQGVRPETIAGIIPLDTGPYNVELQIESTDPATGYGKVMRQVFGNDPAKWRAVSPILHMGPDGTLPPFLVVHAEGRADVSRQAAPFVKALQAARVDASLVAAAGKDHGAINRDLGRPGDSLNDPVLAFLKKHSTAKDLSSNNGPLVGDSPTKARSSDGRYISWREHIIDDSELAGFEISGSDGLTMADLDRDGHLDIVSVHESDTSYDGAAEGHIRIAFGSADPDRWELVTLSDGPDAAAAEDVAIADVNGDGWLDVIGACELSHLIYHQNPGKEARTQTWKRTIPEITRNRGSFIRVFFADFNGDGRPEAVAPNKGEQNPPRTTTDKNPVSIFSVDGDPLDGDNWTEHVLGQYIIPQNSEPVDLDGDGDLDIVVGSRGENRILWFENLGGPDFSFEEHAIEIDGSSGAGFNLAYADLNHDGRLDIVLGITGGLGWIEQPEQISGSWKAHWIGTFVPDSMTGFTLADIDGDGDLDIIGGSYSRGVRDRDGNVSPDDPLGRIGWFEQPTDPAGEWTRHDISRRKRGMYDKFEGHDLDRDGDIDFVTTRGNSHPYDGVIWLEQVRSEKPLPAFERARATDSAEMPLPASP